MPHRALRLQMPLMAEMDRLFDSLIQAVPSRAREVFTGAFPAVNLWEDDDNVYAEAELPGLAMDDLELELDGDTLTIKGAFHRDVPESASVLRRERSAGSFERTLALPSDVDADRVDATLRHGVLTVTLPKAERARPRRIAVKTLPEG